MEFNFIQLSDKDEIYKTYEIYKHCMFMPTEEKFNKKVEAYLSDDFVKIFACIYCAKITGIIVVDFLDKHKVEILGIAVETSVRCSGMGTYMINQLMKEYNLSAVYAETDNDAVGFYRSNGFKTIELVENFNGNNVTRYKCELIK